MRYYSHLSDEKTVLARHSIGSIAKRPSEVDGLAQTLAQQAAERALLAASRCRSYQLRITLPELSIAQAAHFIYRAAQQAGQLWR
jgi:hypothetical protein